jgi:hypothetical protein
MFKLDPYDECFSENFEYSRNVYCIADVYIKPNKSSQTWNLIEEKSNKSKTQYRHEHLVYGICINYCRDLMSKFDSMTQKQFVASKPINYPSIAIDPFAFRYAVEDKIMYEEILNECVNYQMQKKFQLEAFPEVQYCDEKGRIHKIGKSIKSSIIKPVPTFKKNNFR